MAELVLGRLKFHWKGDWTPSTAFIKDDVVKYGPTAWVCIENHTSGADFDFTKFEQMVEGITWAGEWAAGKYEVNDIVNYGGAIYVCIADHDTGDSTDTSPNNSVLWARLVGGLEWESTYDGSTTYQKGDIVQWGGYTYISIQTGNGNKPNDTNYWEILNKGYTYSGAYNNSLEYKPGELVQRGGRIYACSVETTAGTAPEDASYWFLFADGQKWQGNWSISIQYQIGDIVKYGAKSFVCILSHLSVVGITPNNASYWSLYNDGTRWISSFSGSTNYLIGDLVRYGGVVYICTQEVTGTVPTEDAGNAYWDIYADGFDWASDWSVSSVTYKYHDVVRYGGRSYICIAWHVSDANRVPTNTSYWQLLNKGLDYKGAWVGGTNYKLDDVVEYSGTAYVCIQAHDTTQTPNSAPAFWSTLAQGDISSPMTTEGDIIYRSAGGNIVRLGIGPAGSFLTSTGTIPTWGHQTPQNDYYVSPQGNDSNDGRTPTTSWKTIRHACDQTFSLGQCRINVSSGTYAEQCPIRVGRSVVLEGNGLGAVTVAPDTTNDNGFGVGISDDGSTPNANSYVFHMNNGCRMRNFVFRNFSTGSVLVSLDPGNGPDDTSVWITSQSPYVQNCTSFTPEGTGFKIDGSLHNGGYKSMVANDWTQINSDGIGIHVLNDGRTEIVSCFTYYCNIGYLAESGGKIRGIVGNNSYGEYGAVARGFSQSETPLIGKLRLTTQTINSVTQLADDVHVFTSYRDSVGNRFFVGHTAPTASDVSSTFDNAASYPFVAKFNSAGSLDWIYTYETTFGAIHSAVELSDRIYCGGVIRDGGTNKGFILSISKAGEIQWQKTVGDTSEIVEVTTDDNNLYAVGNHNSAGVAVIKLNPAGVEQWSRTLKFDDSSVGTNITVSSCTFAKTPTTSVDTYALAGDATAENNLYVAMYDSNDNQSIIARINSSGGFQTSYIYGDVRINALRLDTGNGDGIYLMAAGYYDPAGAVTKSPLLFRISVNGTVQWQTQLSIAENGEYTDVLPFGNDVYACGYLNDASGTVNKGIISRYTSNGSLTWNRQFGNGTNNIWLTGVMLDGVNVIAAGNETNDGVILNIQRDLTNGIGTISSGSYTLVNNLGITYTNSTVVTRGIQAIDQNAVALGVTDESLTLNQTPSQARTVVATRPGFAGIGTGVLFTADELDRAPKEGSVLQIDGDSETYFVIGVSNFLEGDSTNDGTCQIQLDPPIPSNKTPNDQTTLTFREAFSQVRMSGHDFLDIGTGGFADTNYPVIIDADYTQPPSQDRETLAENGGRVFYVTTDQDGNFRVGDYFKVEQATGRATLSSEEFDLAGLNELQLGSITAGKQGATINEFSTDGTFADNSDTAVPTEKATKTYVDIQIAQAVAGAGTIQVGTSPNVSKVEVTGSGASTDTIEFDIAGTEVAEIGAQYLKLPTGTTGDRPGTPVTGMFRYNTTNASLEVYGSSSWEPAGSIKWSIVSTASNISKGEGLMCDTSGGGFIVTLPSSPLIGDAVRIMDLAGTFDTDNLVIARNGENIMGLAQDLTLSTENAAIGLVYSNATYGWKLIEVL
jgi:hypothetical protein